MSSAPSDDGWDFDTIRTNPYAPSAAGSSNNTFRGRTSGGISTALHHLALNSAPNSENVDSRGRNVGETGGRAYGTSNRRRTSAAADRLVMVEREPETEEPDEEMPMITPQLDYGRNGSTVRPFRRVSDTSDRGADLYTTLNQDENRAPAVTSSTEEGALGRQVLAEVVQPAIEKVGSSRSPTLAIHVLNFGRTDEAAEHLGC